MDLPRSLDCRDANYHYRRRGAGCGGVVVALLSKLPRSLAPWRPWTAVWSSSDGQLVVPPPHKGLTDLDHPVLTPKNLPHYPTSISIWWFQLHDRTPRIPLFNLKVPSQRLCYSFTSNKKEGIKAATKMAVTTHDIEEKQLGKPVEESPDGSTKDKPLFVHEETFHNAAERGQTATDR